MSYSRSFIESHTVYVRDGEMLCQDCGDERIGELEDRIYLARKELDRAIDSLNHERASIALLAYFKAESERAELADARVLDDGESDSPRSCGECLAFIDGALTDEGARYVAFAIVEFMANERESADVIREWAERYFPGADLSRILADPSDLSRILSKLRQVHKLARASLKRWGAWDAREPAGLDRAMSALRDAWIRFKYGGDDVRETIRGARR